MFVPLQPEMARNSIQNNGVSESPNTAVRVEKPTSIIV